MGHRPRSQIPRLASAPYPALTRMQKDYKVSRREFLNLGLAVLVEAALLGVGGLTYASQLEPLWHDVTFLDLALPGLEPSFDGYRLAQISDIHIGTWMNRDRLMQVVNRINAQNPDLVVITGDFVHHNPGRYIDDLVIPLQGLKSRDGTLAVLGNHDHWTNAKLVRTLLENAGIQDISNQVHTLERDRSLLHIAGVDDVWEHKDRLDLVLEALPKEGSAILLAHEPDYADISAQTGRFDLQLSGHSHGGQVILPFIGSPVLPFLGQKYPLGFYRIAEMYQYTNRGIGMTSPPVRFNCRPEITLLTLKSPS